MSRHKAEEGEGASTLIALLCALYILVLVVGVAGATQPAAHSDAGSIGSEDGLTVSPAPAAPADVPPEFWAYREIMACTAAGIVQGYPDGLYHPELQIDRGSTATFIAKAMLGGEGAPPIASAGATFADVPADFWAAECIQYAAESNAVTGYPDGTFRPESPVDRGQMAVFIARSVVTPVGEEGLAAYIPPATPTFSDVPASSWCFKHVEYLAAARVASGYSDGTYRPEVVVTRDQMAVYVARAFGID
ncbi:MAG: S-layer homology domain-containing protein [Armatimonadota bacterium]